MFTLRNDLALQNLRIIAAGSAMDVGVYDDPIGKRGMFYRISVIL